MELKFSLIIFIVLISLSCSFASENLYSNTNEQNININITNPYSNNDNLIHKQNNPEHIDFKENKYYNFLKNENKTQITQDSNLSKNIADCNNEKESISKAYFDVSIDNHYYGEKIEIKGYLRNDTHFLTNKTLSIKKGNTIYNCTTDINGFFTYNLTDYGKGLNNVTFLFEDDNYNETKFTEFIVFKQNNTLNKNEIEDDNKITSGNSNSLDMLRNSNTKLNTFMIFNSLTYVVGDNANISVQLHDEYGNNVNEGLVVFKINGVTIKDEYGNVKYANVNNGIASISYHIPLKWISKPYNISSVYGGTNIYESFRTQNYTLEFIKRTTNINITTQEQAKSSETITLTVLLSDEYVDEDGIVLFKFNGMNIKDQFDEIVRIKVENHVAQYNYTLPLGLSANTYSISTIYSSKYFETIENNTLITINKLNTKIIFLTTDANRKYPHLEAEIYDEYDNLLVGSINYTIKVNGNLLKEGTTNNSEIDTYLDRDMPMTTMFYSIELIGNDKYNPSINTSPRFFMYEITTIHAENLYTLSKSIITINTGQIGLNTSLVLYLDNDIIYNSKINSTSSVIEQYIPIDYEGVHKLKAKIYNNTRIFGYRSKNITISSRYIYVNSHGNLSSDGSNKNNPTTLEKALQITSPEKIILLTTTNSSDVYNMSNIIINSNTTNSHQINIIGEKGKTIIFDGHLSNRLFIIEEGYNLSMVNTVCINGYGYIGGLFVNYGNLNLINNTFINNQAFLSSAVIFNNGNLSLIKNEVYDNKVLNYTRYLTGDSGTTANGGVICSFLGDIILMNNKFYNNLAQYGGVVNSENSTITFINNTFFNNSVKYSGGVLYLNNSTSFSSNNIFKNNSAMYGAVNLIMNSISYSTKDAYLNNEGVYGSSYIKNSYCEFYETLFRNNNATYGGSIYMANSTTLIDNSSFNNNRAVSHGASISSCNSNIIINNTLFYDNKVINGCGGSLYVEKTNSHIINSIFKYNQAKQGGALSIVDDNFNLLENNNFLSNKASEGGAIYATKGNIYINNTIFKENNANECGGAIFAQLTNSLNVEESLFQLNKAEEYSNIYTIETSADITDNQIYSNNTKSVLINKISGNINENYWGTNNPNFTILTTNITPNSWKILENNNFTYIYNNETLNLITLKRNFTISTNNNNNVTTIIPKKHVNIYVDDILTTKNKNIIINVTFSEKISSNILFNLTNGTIITKNINNNNKTQITYKTSNTEKMEKITIILPENDEYSLVTKNLNIFVQNNTSYFNLMDYNLVTPVKNQFSSPTCWAFASISALESAITKEYNVSYDFSENHLKNIINKYSLVGTDTEANSGSSLLRPLNYMVSWYDPLLENDDHFYENSTISPIISPAYHVQDAIIIESTKNESKEKYKDMILKYGAIYTDFNSEGRCDISTVNVDNEIVNNTINYYSFEEKDPTHAITLIGWDDNYSKYNFNNSGHIPQDDGAFIIKNSWGTDNGINGINYVSYYDLSLAVRGLVAFSVENQNNYTSIYQHETCSVTSINTNSSTAYVANTYQSTKNEEIQAVGTFFHDKSNYTVTIYKNGIEQYSQDGHVSTSSFKTIELNEYIPLVEGDEFTAIIKIATNTKTRLMVQDSLEMTSDSITNESFVSFDGINWINLYDYHLTACLKVYTGNSNIIATNNKITNKTIIMILNDNRPTSIPDMINNQDHVFNYSLAHYIIKVPTTRTVVENNNTVNKSLERKFFVRVNDKVTSLRHENYTNGCLLNMGGIFLSNDYVETDGIYFKENFQEKYVEIHIMYNMTNDINKLEVIAYSNVVIAQGQVQQFIIYLNNEIKLSIGVYIPQINDNYYLDEYIKTQFIFNNQSIERTEHIYYYSFNPKSMGQTYVITKTKIDNETYLNWTNNAYNHILGSSPTKMAFNTIYLNDFFADMVSNILNVTWDRNDYTIVLSGVSDDVTYIHTINSTMGIDVGGDEESNRLFRFLTTYLLSFWEEKSLNWYNFYAESALTKIIKSLDDDGSFNIFEVNNTIILVVGDDTNTTIVIDGETGIVSDYVQYGGNIYHGLFSDDQHTTAGFEVGSPEAELERLVGSTILSSSGYLIAIPLAGPEIAVAVGIVGALICADGCGLLNSNPFDNQSRWVDFGWDIATSLPYSHILGWANKVQKLSGVVSKLNDIDRTFINFEKTIKNSNNILERKLYENVVYLKEIILDQLFDDDINLLTRDIIKKYYEILRLPIPSKEFTEYFDFLFKIDKKPLFDGSHLIEATDEIFCERINQLPTGLTKFLYICYGFAKTSSEKSTQYLTGKISEQNDMINDVFSMIGYVKKSEVNEERVKNFDVNIEEYAYVEQIRFDDLEVLCL